MPDCLAMAIPSGRLTPPLVFYRVARPARNFELFPPPATSA